MPSGGRAGQQEPVGVMEPQAAAIELRLHSVLGLPAAGTSVVAEVRRPAVRPLSMGWTPR